MNENKKPRSYSAHEQIQTLDRIFLAAVKKANRLDVDEPKLKWVPSVFSDDAESRHKSSTGVFNDTKEIPVNSEDYLPLPHVICHRHKTMVRPSEKLTQKAFKLKNIFRQISTFFW